MADTRKSWAKRIMIKILIIEDNEDDRLIIKKVLQKLGYEHLVFADTGEEGISKAKHENPRLIITDTILPGLGGVEICRKIKKLKPLHPVKVFILTGFTNASDAAKAAKAGADAYIAKTSDYLPLIKIMKKHYRLTAKNDFPNILREQMKTQRKKWISKFPKKAEKIKKTWAILRVKYKKETFKNLYQITHNLMGSARVFRITPIIKAVKPLDSLLNSISDKNRSPLIKEQTQIASYIKALNHLAVKSDYQKHLSEKTDEQNFYSQF